MPTRYESNEKLYCMGSDGEWHELCKVKDIDILTEEDIMDEQLAEYVNATKKYENHWYLRVPFTKKRLIFAGLRYQGWYTFK